MRPGLGHVQRAMLARLAACEQTTASLADLASRSVVCGALDRLAVRGPGRVTGEIPAASQTGAGRPRSVWSITGKGRDVHAGRAS